eukprot:COSAG02_NODE_5319_length_4442_cov_2.816947_3_plen_196_part_00
MPYHSVGYLLNPKYMDVDHTVAHTAQGNDGIYEELMSDFDTVATRLCTSHDGVIDNDKVGRIMVQYAEYLSSDNPLRNPNGPACSTVGRQLIKEQPWKWWKAFGPRYYPDLSMVAMRVLSKQVGIGAVERSHKKMKNAVFSKDRGTLSAAKANVGCYINCNAQQLDRNEANEPSWLESYDESDLDGVLSDVDTTE